MGGGTGTGAAPVVAKLARRVKYRYHWYCRNYSVTSGRAATLRPGACRYRKLKEHVDSMLVVSNENCNKIRKSSGIAGFKKADNITYRGERCCWNHNGLHGNINIDFATSAQWWPERCLPDGNGPRWWPNRAMNAVRLALSRRCSIAAVFAERKIFCWILFGNWGSNDEWNWRNHRLFAGRSGSWRHHYLG